MLVGPDYEAIKTATCRLLDESSFYAGMAVGASPYGDGASAGRIVEVLERDLLSGTGSSALSM